MTRKDIKIWLFLLAAAACTFYFVTTFKPEEGFSEVKPRFHGRVRGVLAGERKVNRISISPKGTIISFPVKPSKVVVGRQKVFDFDYIENDIAVAPLAANATCNVFVYLLGKRYTFLLEVSASGDDIVIVSDGEGEATKLSDLVDD